MEKLIALAESLYSALYEANAIDATAPTSDAFGDIATALKKVLVHITGSKEEAERVYGFLIETQEPLRRGLVAGYEVSDRVFANSWKVTDPDGETIGRIYLNAVGWYSPERAIDRVLPTQRTMDAAVLELVQDFRHWTVNENS